MKNILLATLLIVMASTNVFGDNCNELKGASGETIAIECHGIVFYVGDTNAKGNDEHLDESTIVVVEEGIKSRSYHTRYKIPDCAQECIEQINGVDTVYQRGKYGVNVSIGNAFEWSDIQWRITHTLELCEDGDCFKPDECLHNSHDGLITKKCGDTYLLSYSKCCCNKVIIGLE